MAKTFCNRFIAILLAALFLAGAALPRIATAHERTPALTAMAAPRGDHHSTTPGSGHAGDNCLCCTLGQCSMVTAALLDHPGVLLLFGKQAAPYQGFIAAIAEGLAITPTPPPPRLNA